MYRGKLSALLARYENLSKCNDGFHSFRQASGQAEFKCSSCGCNFPYSEVPTPPVALSDYVLAQFKDKKKGLNIKTASGIIAMVINMEEEGVYLSAQWYKDIRSLLLKIVKSQVNIAAAYVMQVGVPLDQAKDHVTFKAIINEDYGILPKTANIMQTAQVEAAIATVASAISIYEVNPQKYGDALLAAKANLKKLEKDLLRAKEDAAS